MSSRQLNRLQLRAVLRELVDLNRGVVKIIPIGSEVARHRSMKFAIYWMENSGSEEIASVKAWCSRSGLTAEKLHQLHHAGWNTQPSASLSNVSWEHVRPNRDLILNSICWSLDVAFGSESSSFFQIKGNQEAIQVALTRAGITASGLSSEEAIDPTSAQRSEPVLEPHGNPEVAIATVSAQSENSSDFSIGKSVCFDHRGTIVGGVLEELSEGFALVRVVDNDLLPDNTYKMSVSKIRML